MRGGGSLVLAAFADASPGLRVRLRLLARPRRAAGRLVGIALAGLSLLLPIAVYASVPAPRLPSASYLVRLAAPGVDGARVQLVQRPNDGEPRRPLPRTPTSEEVTAAIGRHHTADVIRRIEPGEALWFIVDRGGQVLHTGVAEGSASEIQETARAQHPDAGYDHILSFKHAAPGGDGLRIIWLFPGPIR